MPSPQPASEILDREFLVIRSRLIDLAAALDRVDRGGGLPGPDPRLAKIRRALEVLLGDGPDRAEKVQHVFSLPYDEQWQKAFQIPAP